ncbi:protein 5NUC-like isoform X1 [Aricia agestis]|uniref:protein 5NUC-like isoform X1 n=1 Tax=Aricia agestis TaxID=91739 RepID=UPI001C2096AC|nr:protein 5NUC-like isoform X1 [Aricia agestis]
MLYLTLLLLGGVSASIVKPSTTSAGNFELLILHNNDMHARFEQTSQLSGACAPADRDAGKCYGGFPRVAHVVKEARKAAASGEGPPVLYLNAGDTYTGTAWFTIYKWKVAAEFLNALQPDAVSLGNHELDEKVEGLTPFIRNLTSPVVAANLILDNVPELQNEPNLYKSVVLHVNGKNIGIIGYLTPDTRFLAPKNNIEYEDEVTAIAKEVQKLKEQGVDILIALGHSGFIKDLEIAKDVEDIDIVIGGHSNTFLWNSQTTNEKPEYPQGLYPTIVTQKSGRNVLVVQAYAYTKYMGSLRLTFDDNGEIIHFSGDPILLNHEIPEDPNILEMIDVYRSDVDRINNEVVGSSNVFLDGDQCRLRECNIGDMISDAVLLYTKEHYKEDKNVTIAVIQGGRIRSSLDNDQKPFKLTRGDWITVVPFTDNLCVMTLTGTVLKQALEHSVEAWRTIDTPGQFLQMSGMKIVYDLAKPPGSRVVEAKATCAKCTQLEDIRDDHEYNLITSGFIADGGDGFSMFEAIPKEIMAFNEMSAILDYTRKYSPVEPIVSNRITVLNEDHAQNIPIINKYSSSLATSSKISLVLSKLVILFTLLTR